MSAEVMIAVVRHTEVEEKGGPYYWQERKTKRVSEDLMDVTAELDDKVCAAMLRGLADVLDPPLTEPEPERGLAAWERDLLRGQS